MLKFKKTENLHPIIEKQDEEICKLDDLEGHDNLRDNLCDDSCYDSYDYTDFKVKFTPQEKIKCLEEILSKLRKILYVYEKSAEENSQYNYKIYCGGILLYVSSSNSIFEGELVNLIVNLNSIIVNNFTKQQIKRLVFESKNEIELLLEKYKQENDQNADL